MKKFHIFNVVLAAMLIAATVGSVLYGFTLYVLTGGQSGSTPAAILIFSIASVILVVQLLVWGVIAIIDEIGRP